MTYCSDCIAYENGECTMYRERIIEKYRAICFTSKNGMKVDRAEKEKLFQELTDKFGHLPLVERGVAMRKEIMGI